ncbi:NAD(P)H dehydrogenase (quinone) FQR1 [Smittium mucronatum]|uniref:NAD(P)H dehydrogenase (Quinone) FQR1 n=1 Tax=Smittium mucronatum TaxID=133383 RepID=A0A1R0GPK9_9FUNG|nr:NAD(P)H dehydrogenase (quinone) FQR1 [Smittium mucronatum]
MTKPTVYVVYYSTYGHVKTIADSIVEGLKGTDLVDVKLCQFQETLPQEVLEKMHAPEKDAAVPIFTLDDLTKGDAFLFGFPTRYGTVPAQVKTFWDSTGGLWASGALQAKMVGLFFSTASQNGGQETTALTFLPNLVHHGMIFVPMGYTHNNLFDVTEVVGGSPYGAGTIATSTGARMPSVKEKEIAVNQGERFAKIVSQYHA